VTNRSITQADRELLRKFEELIREDMLEARAAEAYTVGTTA
jgi:hypothetical protein